MRSALIVAKPTDFGEAVSLLKKLQCRKLNERNGEVNLGMYHPGRKNTQGNEGHSVVGREAGASQTVGTSPEAYNEPANRSWRNSGHEWENRAGPSGEGGNRWKNNDGRSRAQRNHPGNFVERNEGQYNKPRSGHPYRNNNFRNGGGPARINFFRAEYNNSNWNGRSRPYWMRRNVSHGYYRPRNNGNRNRGNRGRGSNWRRPDRGNGSGNQSDASNSPPAQSQRRNDDRNRRLDESAGDVARLANNNNQPAENENGM